MLYYAIVATDIPDSLDQRLKYRAEHRDRLCALQDTGRLLCAGPFPAVDAVDPGAAGFTGSLIIAKFDSLESAQTWADQDPYSQHGVFSAVTVKPYNKIFP